MNKFSSIRLMAITSALSLVAVSHAVFLAPGGTVIPAPIGPPPGGSVVGFLSSPYFTPGVFSGTVDTTVLSGDPTNGFGGLTFVYRITNFAVSSHGIGRFTANGFGGWLTDVSWAVPSIKAPALIDRPLPGDRIGFSFFDIGGATGLINPGEFSTVVVRTNAPAYMVSTGAVIDGSVATMEILAPVPEPMTVAALGIGVVGLIRRRRNRI